MSTSTLTRRPVGLVALAGFLLVPSLGRAAGEPPGVAQALANCAAMAADAERLACYDRLAGRAAAGPAASASGAPAPLLPPAAAQSIAPAGAPGAAAQTPAAPSPGTFGFYPAEHPVVVASSALTTRVQALGRSANGRMTVTVEGGALWELADSDPLLSAGDMVTIRRASLGSFLMETPSRRLHRALRLR